MISGWQIYLITRCDAIRMLCGCGLICMVLPILFAVVSFIVGKGDNDQNAKNAGTKILKLCAPIAVICALLASLTPTTKEAIAIVSIPAISRKIVENEEIPRVIKQLWSKYIQEENKKNTGGED